MLVLWLARQETELSVILPSMTWGWFKYPFHIGKAPNLAWTFCKSVGSGNKLLTHLFLYRDQNNLSTTEGSQYSQGHLNKQLAGQLSINDFINIRNMQRRNSFMYRQRRLTFCGESVYVLFCFCWFFDCLMTANENEINNTSLGGTFYFLTFEWNSIFYIY